jgi:hypothetical protein
MAQSYAVHMLSIYHHYRWRFYRSHVTDKNGKPIDSKPRWNGLVKGDEWQSWYKTGMNRKEIDFWFGQ